MIKACVVGLGNRGFGRKFPGVTLAFRRENALSVVRRRQFVPAAAPIRSKRYGQGQWRSSVSF